MDVQFQPRQQDIFISPLQLQATAELVAVSQLSSYQPAKPFLLVGHGSCKPFSKNRSDEWSLRAKTMVVNPF